MNKLAHRLFVFLLYLICVHPCFVLCGCKQGGTGATDTFSRFSFEENDGDARLSVFMRLKEPDGPLLWIKVSGVEVFSGNAWIPLRAARLEVQSKEIEANGQILIGRGGVPAGSYQRLRLVVEKAALEKNGQKLFLSPESSVIEIPFPAKLAMSRDDSTSIFITWDTEASLQGQALIVPQMTIALQSIPLVTDLAYVACPEINTLYIIRTDQNMICGSIGMRGKPNRLVANLSLNRLYVLTPDDSAVKILELTSNRQIDYVNAPLSIRADQMAIDPSGRWAYLLDERSNQLLRLNLNNGVVGGQVRLGSRPRYVLYLEEQNLLAVSCAYAQKVYFLDPITLATVKTIETRGTPDGLLVQDNSLYIAETSSNTVSVFDLASNKMKARILVGTKPRRFLFGNNHVYLSNQGGGTVSVLRPGQLNVLRNLSVGGSPYEMDVYPARQWLYVGDTSRGSVTVIDISTNSVVRRIELGAASDGLVVIR